MARTVVGVAANLCPVDAEGKNIHSSVSCKFAESIRQVGGLPLVIPVGDESVVHDYVEMIDKLILTGGQNVHPQFYGEEKTIDSDDYNFSFSGMKSAVINFVHNAKQRGEEIVPEDLACSFQTAVVEVLIAKTKKAIVNLGVKQLILAGGVAGNSELRKQVLELEQQLGVEVLIPKMSYCSDNAAMMGAAGYYYYKNNIFANPLTLNAKSTLDLEEVKG